VLEDIKKEIYSKLKEIGFRVGVSKMVREVLFVEGFHNHFWFFTILVPDGFKWGFVSFTVPQIINLESAPDAISDPYWESAPFVIPECLNRESSLQSFSNFIPYHIYI